MITLADEIIKTTGASVITGTQSVQSLWSGYGEIKRVYLKSCEYPSIIVKHIKWPDTLNHPRGWNTERSHQRKLKSYQIEKNWYEHFAKQTDSNCRIPNILATIEQSTELLLIMEDLDANGFEDRITPQSVTIADAKNCLSWLAHFHAKFMGINTQHLWPVGTYWHLDTRPDEWKKMSNIPLQRAAKQIDERLEQSTFQTLVHGDAKLANFCFGATNKVAAVDFQYVGMGCGMKDVAYFISSCFDDSYCEQYEKELLDHYFSQVEVSLDKSADFQGIKEEWSSLYKYAWADFYRFLDGWSPGHWKMHGYSERLAHEVIDELNQ